MIYFDQIDVINDILTKIISIPLNTKISIFYHLLRPLGFVLVNKHCLKVFAPFFICLCGVSQAG